MKTFLILILSICLLMPTVAGATGVDVSSMSDEEIAALMEEIAKEKKNRPTDAEILFHDIPWGINIVELLEALKEKNAIGEKEKSTDTWQMRTMEVGPDTQKLMGRTLGVSISASSLPNEYFIAGYHPTRLSAYCHYENNATSILLEDESSHFYLIELSFGSSSNVYNGELAYEDLQGKLSELYGPCDELKSDKENPTTNSISLSKWSVWAGKNDTAVVLSWSGSIGADGFSSGGSIQLAYGKLNSVEVLSELREIEFIENSNRQKEFIERHKDNYDGL